MEAHPPSGLYVDVGAGAGGNDAGKHKGGKAMQLCFLRSPPLRIAQGPCLPLFRPRPGAGVQPSRAPQLLVPAPILPAARMRPIGLVAPALLRADGQPAWLPARVGRQKRARESEGGAKGNTDVLAAAVACGQSMDGWELQMLQMLVMQGLTQSEREIGAPTLPPALACQLCQMSYGELVEFFGRDEPEAQDQTAAIEGTWKLPHSWTLAHAEAVCRACLSVNRPALHAVRGAPHQGGVGTGGTVPRDFADALLMHLLSTVLKSVARETEGGARGQDQSAADPRAGDGGDGSGQSAAVYSVPASSRTDMVQRIVKSVFQDCSLVACSAHELESALSDLGWDECGELGHAAALQAALSHFEFHRTA